MLCCQFALVSAWPVCLGPSLPWHQLPLVPAWLQLALVSSSLLCCLFASVLCCQLALCQPALLRPCSGGGLLWCQLCWGQLALAPACSGAGLLWCQLALVPAYFASNSVTKNPENVGGGLGEVVGVGCLLRLHLLWRLLCCQGACCLFAVAASLLWCQLAWVASLFCQQSV